MPLSERAESVWFITLACFEICLVGALSYFSAQILPQSTFGFGPSAAILTTCCFALICQFTTIICAASAPQRLDYNIILATAFGRLLSFTGAAALSSSDGPVFRAFVSQVFSITEDRYGPLFCNGSELTNCTWRTIANYLDEEFGDRPWEGRYVTVIALFCMVLEMSIIVVAAYQRCGLTASDDAWAS